MNKPCHNRHERNENIFGAAILVIFALIILGVAALVLLFAWTIIKLVLIPMVWGWVS